MPIEIRETTVTPNATGCIIQLHISDAPPDDESAAFVLTISAKFPALQTPLLAQLQRAAMKAAQDALTPLLIELATELKEANQPIDPSRKR